MQKPVLLVQENSRSKAAMALRALDEEAAAWAAAGSKAVADTATEVDAELSEIIENITSEMNRRRQSLNTMG